MAAPKGNKHAVGHGRPTKYKPEYDELARKLCMLRVSPTDDDLAEFFEVDLATINKWKIKHPSFGEAIKEGKERTDMRIIAAFSQRAQGYSHPDEQIFCQNGKVTRVKTTKHYPPDTAACTIWLRNRQGWSGGDKDEGKSAEKMIEALAEIAKLLPK